MYTFGAPGSSSPAFHHWPGSASCIERLRVVNGYSGWLGTYYDAVTSITSQLGVQFGLADLAVVDLYYGSYSRTPCGSSTSQGPSGWPDPSLHMPQEYDEESRKHMPSLVRQMMRFSMIAYYDAGDVAQRNVEREGWIYVGRALDSPTTAVLAQHPKSLECVISFKGSDSFTEWQTNLQATPSAFCGLVAPDETCTSLGSCTARGHGSFVHRGFRDWFRQLVKSMNWQTRIQRFLPSCSKVTATGHSLGGAMAEMYATCLAKAPQPGEFGYDEDFRFIGFTPGTPQRLPHD